MFGHQSGRFSPSGNCSGTQECDTDSSSVFSPYTSTNRMEDRAASGNWWEDVQAWHAALWRAALLRNALNAACGGVANGYNCSDANNEQMNGRAETPAFPQLPLVSSGDTIGYNNLGASVSERDHKSNDGTCNLVFLWAGHQSSDDVGMQQQDAFLCTLPIKLSHGQQIRVTVDNSHFDLSVNAARAMFCPTQIFPEQSILPPDQEHVSVKDIFGRPVTRNESCNDRAINYRQEQSNPNLCNIRETPVDTTVLKLSSPNNTNATVGGVYTDGYTQHSYSAKTANIPSSHTAGPAIKNFYSRKRARSMQFGSNIRPRKREMSIAQTTTNISPLLQQRGTTSDHLQDDESGNTDTTANETDKQSPNLDDIHLEEIKRFAKLFKMKRLALGLTQTQVGQTLSLTNGPAYSQSAICRFEKLDITPKSAQKIKPVLERWLNEVDNKIKVNSQNPTIFPIHTEAEAKPKLYDPNAFPCYQLSNPFIADQARNATPDSNVSTPEMDNTETGNSQAESNSSNCKRRKRRTSFAPQALELLNDYFERNSHPSGMEMTSVAERLGYDREVIRVWFCNKRQALKNTFKKLRLSP